MLKLNPTLGGNPLWLISDGLNCSECFDPVASPQTTTDFVAQLTTAEGCDIIDTVRVNVLTQQNISAGEDRTICNGETTLLNGQFLYPDQSVADSFAWTPVASLDLPTLLNPEAMPTETTTYALNIFSENCVLTDSVIIEVVNQTEVEATGAIVCLGDTAQLNVIGAADNFTWSPAEGLSDPNIANPTVTATEDMIYTLVASLSSCQADTVEVSVVTKDLPRATLSSVYTMLGETPILMEIENTSMDYIYNWSPATGLSCTDCANPTVTLNQNMNYTVEVTDVFTGCSKVLETSVRLQSFCGEDLVGIPNAFTPNGDGINDVLEIKYSSSLIIENYKFQVFDRWGGMLFETDNINEQWDGTVGGKNVAAGVVIYFMEFPCHLDGKMLQKKGDITIHR